MQPVDSPRQRFLLSDYALPGLLVLALCGGGFFLWTWLKSGPEKAVATDAIKQPVATQADTKPAVEPKADSQPPARSEPGRTSAKGSAEVVVPPTQSAPAPSHVPLSPAPTTTQPDQSSAVPVATTPAPPPTAVNPPPASLPAAVQPSPPTSTAPIMVVPPPKPPFPELKLQGIVFRSRNSSVVINGRTLFEGDSAQGVKVQKVDRQSVTVEFNGETKVLTLE
jgi:hypothetical protein